MATPILTLDLSITRTGWAAQLPNGATVTGAKSFPITKGKASALRLCEFNNWLQILLEEIAPHQVVVEASVCRAQGQSQDSLLGLRVLTQMACASAEIPFADIYPVTLKCLATGKHDASKEQMKARAAELFPDYQPDLDEGADEADSLLLLWVWQNCQEGLTAAKEAGRVRRAGKRAKAVKAKKELQCE